MGTIKTMEEKLDQIEKQIAISDWVYIILSSIGTLVFLAAIFKKLLL